MLVIVSVSFVKSEFHKKTLINEFYLVSVIDSYVCLANDFFGVSL